MRTLILTLSLLLSTALPAQKMAETFGVSITNGHPIEWEGEQLVLLWAGPGQRLVEWHDPKTVPFAMTTQLQVVGFAVYDPRPCAVGSFAWMSSDRYTRTGPNGCDPKILVSNVEANGFGYAWPDPQPWMMNCWEALSPAPSVTFLAHYCNWIESFSTNSVVSACRTACGDGDTFPMMSFLLVRPRIF